MSADVPYSFHLPSRGDVTSLNKEYTTRGQVQVPALWHAEHARWLHEFLRDETPWRTIYNKDKEFFEVDHSKFRESPESRAAITREVFERARYDFQYIYDQYAVFLLKRGGVELSPGHNALVEFFTGAEFLDLMRAVTGDEEIASADVFLGRYRPGHFLTSHDDAMDIGNRRHAYVFNLTPNWKIDWGGLLLFVDDDTGNITSGLRPAFNVLNIFRVPKSHAVSLVAPFAPAHRYTITGWLHGEQS